MLKAFRNFLKAHNIFQIISTLCIPFNNIITPNQFKELFNSNFMTKPFRCQEKVANSDEYSEMLILASDKK